MGKLLDAGETIECHKHVEDLKAIGNSWYHNSIYFQIVNITGNNTKFDFALFDSLNLAEFI